MAITTEEQDFADVRRGLIAPLPPDPVRAEDGRVVWDAGAYAFLEDGPCPPTANPALWRQSALAAQHGLFEVVPGVYQVRGQDLSNITFFEADSGVVVLDPLISAETAAAALALYRRHRGRRPVTGVVYSHSHVDHFGGVRGVTDAEDVAAGRVPVIAPQGFLEHAVGENVVTGPAMARRAVYMYGAILEKGPAGQVGCGLGQTTSTGSVGLIAPTVEITRTGQAETVDGIRFVFQLAPDAEAPAEMNLHLPGLRLLCVPELAGHTLHNVLTPRGALVRDASAWAGHLTEAIQLYAADSDVLIGSHLWPTWGHERVQRFLEEQRDLYAYVHDQSVRMINAGYTGAEIAEELELPPALARLWHTRGFYGTLNHNARAVYQRYMGWFDANPAHLWQHPPVEQAKRYVHLLGGPDRAVAAARSYAEEGDPRFAAELLAHVLYAAPGHAEARALQAEVFEGLGYAAESGPWRNFYLVGARELREGITPTPIRSSPDMLAALTNEQVFRSMAVRLDGPRAAAAGRTLTRWEIGDEAWTLLLDRGVLTPMRGDAPGGEAPHATVRLARAALDAILTGRTTFVEQIQAGACRLEGDAHALLTLRALLVEPDRDFPILTR